MPDDVKTTCIDEKWKDGNLDDIIKTTELSIKIDPLLKDIIIELIYNKIYEVKSNNFKPVFVILSRKSYACLVAHITETGNYYEAGIDGNYPTQIFGLPIVMAGDTPLDVRVLTDARKEFMCDVRK